MRCISKAASCFFLSLYSVRVSLSSRFVYSSWNGRNQTLERLISMPFWRRWNDFRRLDDVEKSPVFKL